MAPKVRGGKHKSSTSRSTTSSRRVTHSKSARRAPPSPTPVDLSTTPSPVASPVRTTSPKVPPARLPVVSQVPSPVPSPIASPVVPTDALDALVLLPNSGHLAKLSESQLETLKSNFGDFSHTRPTEVNPLPATDAYCREWTPWGASPRASPPPTGSSFDPTSETTPSIQRSRMDDSSGVSPGSSS